MTVSLGSTSSSNRNASACIEPLVTTTLRRLDAVLLGDPRAQRRVADRGAVGGRAAGVVGERAGGRLLEPFDVDDVQRGRPAGEGDRVGGHDRKGRRRRRGVPVQRVSRYASSAPPAITSSSMMISRTLSGAARRLGGLEPGRAPRRVCGLRLRLVARHGRGLRLSLRLGSPRLDGAGSASGRRPPRRVRRALLAPGGRLAQHSSAVGLSAASGYPE